MLKAAGLGVAVEEAAEYVKQAANVVTTSCNNDAVAQVIIDYCLEGKDA